MSKEPQSQQCKESRGKIDESECSGTPIALRSDQEEAIMALKRAVAITRAETVMLESPVRD